MQHTQANEEASQALESIHIEQYTCIHACSIERSCITYMYMQQANDEASKALESIEIKQGGSLQFAGASGSRPPPPTDSDDEGMCACLYVCVYVCMYVCMHKYSKTAATNRQR
jgi:hypothetical protein